MNTRILSGVCAASVFAFTVGVLAQDAARPQQPPSSAMKAVTVSGCIQRAADTPAGTGGSAGASRANDAKFLLTKAAMSGTGATGTAGSAAPITAVASEYRLDWEEAKLTPHVGHKVEITGTIAPPSATTQPPAASAANAPTLKVDSIKMVASTCS